MLIESPAAAGDDPAADADVVIVGAGTAGLYLADRMAAAGRRVLLLEAGGRVATARANTETAGVGGRAHRGAATGRARGLGGTSTLWGGQLAPFDRSDFRRAYAPWPLEPDAVLSRYADVYRRVGLARIADDDAYRARLGGVAAEGAEVERFFTRWAPQPNFSALFARRVHEDPKCAVVLNAGVVGLEAEGGRVRALALTDGRRIAVHAPVVFALGTFESHRFFLTAQRRDDCPWRGRTLGTAYHDHLAGPAARVALSDEARFRALFENAVVDGVKLQPKLGWTAESRAAAPDEGVGVSGYFLFDSDIAEHLANLKHFARALRQSARLAPWRSLPASLWATGRVFAPFIWRYVRDRRVMAMFDRGLSLQLQSEQRPIAASRIVGGDAPAADGLLPITIDWRVDGCELDAMRAFVNGCDAWLRRAGVGALEVDPRLRDGDPAFLDGLTDTNHPCGGLAMSADPAVGFTDARLRLHDLPGARLLSTATFPSSSQANCTLTLLALAERLGDELIGGTA